MQTIRFGFRLAPLLRGAFAAAVLSIAIVAPAFAEKGDRDKPIFFNGNSAGADFGTKGGELVGNVVVTQGMLTIHADRIIFHQNPVKEFFLKFWVDIIIGINVHKISGKIKS